jgi:short subunit dehydrogenase-like uncharacterized protein
MTYNVLLYGATGFSGRLIAAEGAARGMSKKVARGDCRMTLAARDGRRLRAVAEKNDMDFRVFGLDDHHEIRKQLDGVDVVINAAGPFAFTAEPIAKAALEARCHYVDINGEIDVYRKLDDFGLKAAQRGVAMVSGAGNSAAASDVLLDCALQNLLSKDGGVKKRSELGAVRIAVSQIMDFTRGSATTVARSLREQVVVVRKGRVRDGAGRLTDQLVISHEPVGKLERAFNFDEQPEDCERLKDGDREQQVKGRPQIASAANMIDTLTARHSVSRNELWVHSIESYIQMGSIGRVAYQLGGMLSPFIGLPWARALMGAQLSLLPEGARHQELERQRHVVVLEIEDVYRRRLIDWRWETPNVYQFTAQLVVPIACRVAHRAAEGKQLGWVTPADALGLQNTNVDLLPDCKLEKREAKWLVSG